MINENGNPVDYGASSLALSELETSSMQPATIQCLDISNKFKGVNVDETKYIDIPLADIDADRGCPFSVERRLIAKALQLNSYFNVKLNKTKALVNRAAVRCWYEIVEPRAEGGVAWKR